MSNQQKPGGNQSAEALAREFNSLKQALDHLATVERDLENQRVQLQSQITRYAEQAPLARRANRHDLADEALARAAQLQQELARVREQLGRVVARQREITTRQLDLLKQTNLGQAAFTPPQQPASRKPRKRRRMLIGLSAAVTLLVLVALGLAQVLLPAPAHPATNVAQTQPSPTATPAPVPSPTAPPLAYPFQPDGTGPTMSQCARALGIPCYSPEQIQQAFGLPTLYQRGYDGFGQTIVILGAGKTDTLQADLHHFDQTWGLPGPPSFKILEPFGPPVPYTCPEPWDALQIENTLDVEWAHAIAPGAKIVLVIGSNNARTGSQADNCGNAGLVDSTSYVLENQLGQVVSMSYGGSELGSRSETEEQHTQDDIFYQHADSIFQQAASQQVTVLASSGDEGATSSDDLSQAGSYWNVPNVDWPASDPYVLAVGGTTLQVQDASGTYGSETVWNDGAYGGATGGGLSSLFPEPTYQQRLPDQAMFQGKRGIPDVSFPAEPNYDLYASFEQGIMGQVNFSRWDHWDIFGGTSAAAPCWAGLIAIANQMHGQPLGLIQPALYRLYGRGMHAITSGDNSYAGVRGYSAQPGYNLATGWGTPIADRFLPLLLAAVDDPTNPCPGYQHPCQSP